MYIRVRNVFFFSPEKHATFSFLKPFYGESILLARKPYMMPRETVFYFCHKELYSRK